MRWLRRGARDTSPVSGLDPIQIFTNELELSGFVAPAGQRVTDLLLRGQDLAFLPAGAPVAPENWVAVPPAFILLVVPPPLPRPSPRQNLQRRHRVRIRLPGYEVTGTAYLEPGDEADADLTGRVQSFLPVTSAEIVRDGSAEPEPFEVVIVNLGRSIESRVET
jgi:hypothetical protein